MTSVDGSVPPTWGARRDPARRAFWITYVAAAALTIAVAVLSMAAADREREADVEVTATVLDGRGTSGDDAELLLRIPVPNATSEAPDATSDGTTAGTTNATTDRAGDGVERWVATDEFGDETVGSPIEVHLPAGDVERAHLARDCTCSPFTPADALPLAMLLALPAALVAAMGWPRRRAATVLATSAGRRAVRVWWAGPATGTLVVFDRDDHPLGSIVVPPSARVALPDGSAATLVGRPEPGAPVALETMVGPILPMSALHPLAAQASARDTLTLLRLGPAPSPIPDAGGSGGRWGARRRALRVPAPATVATGVAGGLLPLLVLGLVAPMVPAPWSIVAIGIAGAAVAVQVSTALAAHRRTRAATEAARAAAVSAPPMPVLVPTTAVPPHAGAGIAGAPPLGADRPLEAPGRFLGFALTLTAVSFVWFFLLIIYWPLTALVLVDGARLLIRQPRPVWGRIVRPALPLLTATAVAVAGGWAWLVAISTEDWDLPMAARVPLGVASIPLALLAWRVITVGVTIGGRGWYVRNVVRRTRIDAADVVAVRVGRGRPSGAGSGSRPAGRPGGRPGGLEIDLADGRTILASRFVVSRRSARRLVDQLDLDRPPPSSPYGGPPSGGPLAGRPPDVASANPPHTTAGSGSPLITTARGPFWRG